MDVDNDGTRSEENRKESELDRADLRQIPPRPSSRAVVDELGNLYRSALAAAEARGMQPSTAYVRARFRRMGWRFAEADEIAAGRPKKA
jgi:hypothetical protein